MKKTNKTYQVYISNSEKSGRMGIGTKVEMIALYDKVKTDTTFDCVILSKWSERYNCWVEMEKTVRG